MALKDKIDNPALNFISGEPSPTTPAPAKKPTQPALKNNREVRLNLLLPLRNKLKLQKLVEREGYKSVNELINYLVAEAVAHEAEPTPEEIVNYREAAAARKKKK